MGPGGAPGDAQQRAPGVHVPIGGAQAGEGRHKADAPGVLHGLRQLVGLLGGLDKAQLVPQPLDGAARVEGAALQGVGGAAVQLPGDGGQQPRLGGHGLAACVHQHKAAGAVCIFGHALRKAALAKQGGVLVPGDARNGDFLPQHVGAAHAHNLPAFAHPGQSAAGDAQLLEQGIVPAQLVDVKQHGAGGVGHVGDIGRPVGEGVHQPGVDGAKAQPPLLRQIPGGGDVLQNPLHLGAGEVGVDEKPGGVLDVPLHAGGAQALALRGGAAALPHNGVAHRDARHGVPGHGGLPLVGDGDGRDVPGAYARLLHCLAHGVQRGLQNLHRVVLHIARLGVDLGELPLAHARHAPKGVEQHRPGTGGPLVNGQNVLSHHHKAARSSLFQAVIFQTACAKSPLPCPRCGSFSARRGRSSPAPPGGTGTGRACAAPAGPPKSRCSGGR